MPIYDYECKHCGREALNKLGKFDEVRKCKCGQDMVRKMPKPAFQVVGGEYRKMKI